MIVTTNDYIETVNKRFFYVKFTAHKQNYTAKWISLTCSTVFGWVADASAVTCSKGCSSTWVVVVIVSSTLFSSDWIWAVGAWICSAGCCVMTISSIWSSVSTTVIFG